MNKAELIEALAPQFDGNKAEAGRALNAVVETIIFSTAKDGRVSITGFGVFEKVRRPSRMVRNPRTGERKRAKATNVPRFRAGTELKAYVSGEKKAPRATAAKTATATRSTAKATASKTATSKTATKKATPAKKTASKATAKKATTARATAKKTTASKTTAKKATAKKATPAKKTSAARATTRATATRKAPARKSARRS